MQSFKLFKTHHALFFEKSVLLFAHVIYLFLTVSVLFGLYAGLVSVGLLLGFLMYGKERIVPWTLRLYQAEEIVHHDAHHIKAITEKLSRRAKFTQVPAIYYIPSYISIAFSLKDKHQTAIAISDGLIRTHNYRALAGVIAHEVAHIKNNDSELFTFADLLTRLSQGLAWLGWGLIVGNLVLVLFTNIGFSVALLLFAAYGLFNNLLLWSRRQKREANADRSAVLLLKDVAPLSEAIKNDRTVSNSLARILLQPITCWADPSVLRTHTKADLRLQSLHACLGHGGPTKIYQWNQIPHTESMQSYQFLRDDIEIPKRHLNGLWF